MGKGGLIYPPAVTARDRQSPCDSPGPSCHSTPRSILTFPSSPTPSASSSDGPSISTHPLEEASRKRPMTRHIRGLWSTLWGKSAAATGVGETREAAAAAAGGWVPAGRPGRRFSFRAGEKSHSEWDRLRRVKTIRSVMEAPAAREDESGGWDRFRRVETVHVFRSTGAHGEEDGGGPQPIPALSDQNARMVSATKDAPVWSELQPSKLEMGPSWKQRSAARRGKRWSHLTNKLGGSGILEPPAEHPGSSGLGIPPAAPAGPWRAHAPPLHSGAGARSGPIKDSAAPWHFPASAGPTDGGDKCRPLPPRHRRSVSLDSSERMPRHTLAAGKGCECWRKGRGAMWHEAKDPCPGPDCGGLRGLLDARTGSTDFADMAGAAAAEVDPWEKAERDEQATRGGAGAAAGGEQPRGVGGGISGADGVGGGCVGGRVASRSMRAGKMGGDFGGGCRAGPAAAVVTCVEPRMPRPLGGQQLAWRRLLLPPGAHASSAASMSFGSQEWPDFGAARGAAARGLGPSGGRRSQAGVPAFSLAPPDAGSHFWAMVRRQVAGIQPQGRDPAPASL